MSAAAGATLCTPQEAAAAIPTGRLITMVPLQDAPVPGDGVAYRQPQGGRVLARRVVAREAGDARASGDGNATPDPDVVADADLGAGASGELAPRAPGPPVARRGGVWIAKGAKAARALTDGRYLGDVLYSASS